MTVRARARPFAVGANHRSSSVVLRDRLFLDESKAPLFFGQLAERGIAQAIILSTCDRVEVQAVSVRPEEDACVVRELLIRASGQPDIVGSDQIYTLCNDAALRHIFAVAASLDSQTIGEPQVLGQVKEGHRFARARGMMGDELEALLQAAYGAAKRVRSETEIGHRPVSIASAAGRIARDVQGDLSAANILLVGLGDMGDIIVDQLRAAGAVNLSMSGPSRRTEGAARRGGYSFVPAENLDDALQDAEIIVAATGTGQVLITAEAMEGALVQRRRRPVLLIDAGVPGDIEPSVGALEGAFLFTLDDLERVAMEGRTTRGAAAGDAWGIIDQEVDLWQRNLAGREATPAIVALRRKFETTRDQLLAEEPRMDAEEATRMLINRLLHEPSNAVRIMAEAKADGRGTGFSSAEQLLRRIFDLDAQDDKEET